MVPIPLTPYLSTTVRFRLVAQHRLYTTERGGIVSVMGCYNTNRDNESSRICVPANAELLFEVSFRLLINGP